MGTVFCNRPREILTYASRLQVKRVGVVRVFFIPLFPGLRKGVDPFVFLDIPAALDENGEYILRFMRVLRISLYGGPVINNVGAL